jgi:hypothetical protein
VMFALALFGKVCIGPVVLLIGAIAFVGKT